MPPLADSRRTRVAFHEAGHVVAALASGCRVLSARVWGEPSEGFTDLEADPLKPRFQEHTLQIYLAGLSATKRHSPDLGWAGCRSDFSRAMSLAGALAPAGVEPTAVLEDRLAAVDRWLTAPDRWKAVEALAGALLSRGTLDRAAILSLLAEEAKVSSPV